MYIKQTVYTEGSKEIRYST